jgi:hypothetical protein
MSLNRCEQIFYDYLSQRAEERQYWQEKVQRILARDGLNHYTIMALEREIWSGFAERSQVVPVLRQWVAAEGNARTSMRNLAEYMIRLWSPLVPGKKAPPARKSRATP